MCRRWRNRIRKLFRRKQPTVVVSIRVVDNMSPALIALALEFERLSKAGMR